jgi:hypothetical protein
MAKAPKNTIINLQHGVQIIEQAPPPEPEGEPYISDLTRIEIEAGAAHLKKVQALLAIAETNDAAAAAEEAEELASEKSED